MPRHGVRPADTVYVPGGILHTFGPDTLILEVQQTSDLGQFVMPFDLYGNRLDEGMGREHRSHPRELKTDYLPRPNPGLVLEDDAPTGASCAAQDHTSPSNAGRSRRHTEPSHPRRLAAFEHRRRAGGARVRGRFRDARTRRELRLPAAIGEVRVASRNGEATLVACYVPDLERDVVGPLREAGYSDEEIRALGEVEI